MQGETIFEYTIEITPDIGVVLALLIPTKLTLTYILFLKNII